SYLFMKIFSAPGGYIIFFKVDSLGAVIQSPSYTLIIIEVKIRQQAAQYRSRWFLADGKLFFHFTDRRISIGLAILVLQPGHEKQRFYYLDVQLLFFCQCIYFADL